LSSIPIVRLFHEFLIIGDYHASIEYDRLASGGRADQESESNTEVAEIIAIVTDSTSDLPAEVVRDLGITVVPALVRFGDKVYRDGVDLSTDEFYHKLQTNSFLPKTSPASPGTFGRFITDLLGKPMVLSPSTCLPR
jgi:hypothetical protein